MVNAFIKHKDAGQPWVGNKTSIERRRRGTLVCGHDVGSMSRYGVMNFVGMRNVNEDYHFAGNHDHQGQSPPGCALVSLMAPL